MPKEYQAYVVGSDGRIARRIDLTCADDNAAIEQATRLASGHAMELWNAGQKVAELPASD